jgi:pSer/pThr/pTyr-binding forkhead associated (FHA) protein
MYLRLLDADGFGVSAQPDIACDPTMETSIGTAPECTLVLPETGAISGVHAVISQPEENWIVTDHGELTPVWVNGKALGYGETRGIGPGDVLRISTLNICLVIDEEARPATAMRRNAETAENMKIPLMSFQRPIESPSPAEPANHRPGDVDHFFGLAHPQQARPGNDSLLDPLSFFDAPQRTGQTGHTQKGHQESSDIALDALLGIKR